jgi:hypothetical protein
MATMEKKDAPTKLTASFAAQMTEEEEPALLAGYNDPIQD